MRRNKTDAEITLPVAALRGVITGFAVIAALFAVASFFISSGKVPEMYMRHITCGVVFAGSLTGSLITARSFDHRRFLVGAGLGIVMFLLCFFAAAISDAEAFPHRWFLLLLSVFFAGGIFGGILSVYFPKHSRK